MRVPNMLYPSTTLNKHKVQGRLNTTFQLGILPNDNIYMVIQQCGKTPVSHTGLGKRTSPHLLQYRMSSASLPFSALASSANAEKRTTEENSLLNSHKTTENYDRNKTSNKFIPFRKKRQDAQKSIDPYTKWIIQKDVISKKIIQKDVEFQRKS